MLFGFTVEPAPEDSDLDLGLLLLATLPDAVFIVKSSSIANVNGVRVGPEHGSGIATFEPPRRRAPKRATERKTPFGEVSSKKAKSSIGYEYVTLAQARRPEYLDKYINVYAIVTDARPVRRTKGQDLIASFTLFDESLANEPHEVVCNVFGKESDLPRVKELGNILRIHRVQVNDWQGKLQFVGNIKKQRYVSFRKGKGRELKRRVGGEGDARFQGMPPMNDTTNVCVVIFFLAGLLCWSLKEQRVWTSNRSGPAQRVTRCMNVIQNESKSFAGRGPGCR